MRDQVFSHDQTIDISPGIFHFWNRCIKEFGVHFDIPIPFDPVSYPLWNDHLISIPALRDFRFACSIPDKFHIIEFLIEPSRQHISICQPILWNTCGRMISVSSSRLTNNFSPKLCLHADCRHWKIRYSELFTCYRRKIRLHTFSWVFSACLFSHSSQFHKWESFDSHEEDVLLKDKDTTVTILLGKNWKRRFTNMQNPKVAVTS